MRILTLLLLLAVVLPSKAQNDDRIEVIWQDHLEGDFSFTKDWNYLEGVYLNQWGQLSCDWYCPEATWKMKDSTSRIYKDSLERFYSLVDTTHRHHNVEVEARCYEVLDVNYASCKGNLDSLVCTTECNIATHSSLTIEVVDGKAKAWIFFNSITDLGQMYFYCSGGSLTIDKSSLEDNYFKASFDLTFKNTYEPNEPLWWKGKVLVPIERK